MSEKLSATNFWSTCPRRLDYFPEVACHLGQSGLNTKGASGCPWFVNSVQDHYCFWTWLRRNSNKEGFLEPLLQQEIAVLLNTTNAKINATYKEALEKIKQLPEYELLKQFRL